MEAIRQNPGLFMFEGILLIILGVFAIALPQLSTLSISIIIGWALIIGGIYRFFRTFKMRREERHFWLSLLASIVAILFGAFLLTNIVRGIFILTVFLAVYFLIDGIASIFLAMSSKDSKYWNMMLFSGIITLILAALIISGLPYTAIWVLGLLLGINLIMTGFSMTLTAAEVEKIPAR